MELGRGRDTLAGSDYIGVAGPDNYTAHLDIALCAFFHKARMRA